MNFVQNKKDGSCDLNFSKEEIKTILKNKKIHFSADVLRDFGNCLTKMVAEWNINFNEELRNKQIGNREIFQPSRFFSASYWSCL